MKVISQSRYEQLEEEYIKEQYKLTNPKPNGMYGNWGWYETKKREFQDIMIKEGYRLESWLK